MSTLHYACGHEDYRATPNPEVCELGPDGIYRTEHDCPSCEDCDGDFHATGEDQ